MKETGIKEELFKYSKWIKFTIVILLFFLNSLLQIIPIKVFNINPNIINPSNKLYNPNITILLNIFSSLITLIIIILFYRKDLIKEFKEFKSNKSSLLDKGLKIWVAGLLLMVMFNIIINIVTPNNIANNEESVRSMLYASPILTIVCTSFLAPMIEEITFRKSFKTIIKNDLLYVLISGFIFGAMHVVLSIENIYDYLYLLPYCSLGFAFSYMYYKTKNICVPITFHFIHNTMTVLMTLFMRG